MAKIGKIQEVAIADLKPYERNAKLHSDDQVDKIAASIEEFGFLNPVLIDKDKNVIAGHGRIMAAQKLGRDKVPCLPIEGLTEAQRRAYILADNKLTELGEWNMETVLGELKELQLVNFDIELTGFEVPSSSDWFQSRERYDTSREEGNDEYNAFLDKFEQPKTTDDCYTPDNIYEAVEDYVESISDYRRESFFRPFYPGGDYQGENYDGKAVVDNPPFSILAEIVDYFTEQNIPFFLFAPGLAGFNYITRPGVTCISTYEGITYENGASVSTSFITNMLKDDIAAMTAPEFSKKLCELNEINERAMCKSLPKYDYPVEIITAARLGYISGHGENLIIKRKDAMFVRTLDAMKESGKGIYGGGLLLSKKAAAEKAAAEKAAAEKAAAEKAAATCWPLSEREIQIVNSLGEGGDE